MSPAAAAYFVVASPLLLCGYNLRSYVCNVPSAFAVGHIGLLVSRYDFYSYQNFLAASIARIALGIALCLCVISNQNTLLRVP